MLYEVDFQTSQNEDLAHQFDLITPEEGGEDVDLVGATLKMAVRPANDDPDDLPALILSTDNGGIIIEDAAAGVFSILALANQMDQLTPGRYQHDLIHIREGRTLRIWRGWLTVTRGITFAT